ncbi:MAG: WD40 repeat domain-containing protein [Blastocatellia bacterium]
MIEQVGDENSSQRTYYAWQGESVIAEYSEVSMAALTKLPLLATLTLAGLAGSFLLAPDGSAGGFGQRASNLLPTARVEQLSLAMFKGPDKEQVAGPRIQTALTTQKGIAALVFSPNGKFLVAGAESKSLVTVWETSGWRLRSELASKQSPLSNAVSRLHFSPNGQWLEAGSYSEKVSIWNLEAGELTTTLVGFKDFTSGVAFSPDNHRLAMTSFNDRRVTLWDVAKGRLMKTFTMPPQQTSGGEPYNAGAVDLAFSPDGHTLATAVDRQAYLWDISTGEIKGTLIGHTSTIYAIAFSADGKTIATISRDATARLWDAATGQAKAILRGHNLAIRRMAFSPDARTLATGSQDETAKLWDVQTGRLIATLPGHRDTVWSISFSPDSRLVATASGKTAKLWDAKTGELRQTLDGMHTPVAFSPIGHTLATAGKGGTLTIWDVSSVH